MDHAAKLCRAFDALSIDFHHHVIFLEARLCRGTVWNDLSQDHTALGRELQFLGLIRSDFVRFDTQPARTVVPDDDIHAIRFDFRLDFDLPRVLLDNHSLRGLHRLVRVFEFHLLVCPALKLRLQFCLQFFDLLLQACDL